MPIISGPKLGTKLAVVNHVVRQPNGATLAEINKATRQMVGATNQQHHLAILLWYLE
jgi:hypothetical protein